MKEPARRAKMKQKNQSGNRGGQSYNVSLRLSATECEHCLPVTANGLRLGSSAGISSAKLSSQDECMKEILHFKLPLHPALRQTDVSGCFFCRHYLVWYNAILLPSESSNSATSPIPLSVLGYKICPPFDVANLSVSSMFSVLK